MFERESLKNRMRIFGWKESDQETETELKTKVVEEVFKKANPKEKRHVCDIKYAFK